MIAVGYFSFNYFIETLDFYRNFLQFYSNYLHCYIIALFIQISGRFLPLGLLPTIRCLRPLHHTVHSCFRNNFNYTDR